MLRELNECSSILEKILKGIAQKLYREDINIESYVTFTSTLFSALKKVPALKRNHKKLN
jgi:hypothetical protein